MQVHWTMHVFFHFPWCIQTFICVCWAEGLVNLSIYIISQEFRYFLCILLISFPFGPWQKPQHARILHTNTNRRISATFYETSKGDEMRRFLQNIFTPILMHHKYVDFYSILTIIDPAFVKNICPVGKWTWSLSIVKTLWFIHKLSPIPNFFTNS